VPSDSIATFARQVIEVEAAAVAKMAAAVDDAFVRAAELIQKCPATLLTCGIGKAGHVARKVSATFSSTGTPSHYLNPAEAAHGDLGAVRNGDVVLVFSYSGESDEILRMLSILKKLDHPVIAITQSKSSGLGRHSDVVIQMGPVEEACPLGLAPSASTTAMLALGDALALSVMKLRNFTRDDFAIFHPGGQLGRKLIKVAEAMSFKAGDNLPLARDTQTVGEVLSNVAKIKRRCGAVVLTDAAGKMSGIFSDGDLRRLVTGDVNALKRTIGDVMTKNPRRIRGDQLASEAMAIMHQFRFDELPVVDEQDRPIGVIDVQDLVMLKMLDVDDKA